MKKNKRLIIHHHLGLGDHIICNGLVNEISKTTKIFLICKMKNYFTVRHLYKENKYVTVVPIIKFLAKTIYHEKRTSKFISNLLKIKILYIGFQKPNNINWDKSFYKQTDVNFNKRYINFSVPPYFLGLKPPKEKFRLIHSESSSKNFDLKLSKDELINIYVSKKRFRNFFSYINLIKTAEEIHCIDSSFIHLVDSYDLNKNNLYYHNVRKADVKFTFNNSWKVINYT